jgi:thioredoxin 1
MGKIVDLTEAEQFDEVISDPERPAIVDFWADWCGPCKMMTPVLERLAREYDGRMTFAKLNVDEFPEISNRFGVRSIPTMIIFRKGKTASRITGFKPEAALRPQLDRYALRVEDDASPALAGHAEATAAAPNGGGLLAGLKRLLGG